MRISEMLVAIANWLEDSDNEAMLLAEYDEECLKVVAESCLDAAGALRVAAEKVDAIEPPEESKITPEAIDEVSEFITALDYSGDEELQKRASVLDELLLSIASPPGAFAARKDLLDNRSVVMKKNYEEPRETLNKANMLDQAAKAIDKSDMTKDIDIQSAALSARTCPDHPGSQLGRVGEHMFRCELDGKIYNYETGYTLNSGERVPGGDVSLQTSNTLNVPYTATFDSRQERLNSNR
jgi:hypothetical protein